MLLLRILALAAVWLTPLSVAAQQRTVAVTFDDLPYQASAEALCDRAQARAMTRAFVDMLRPLETRATVFVNEGKVCDEQRATLLPELLTIWLDAGLALGNHTFSHINIHRNSAEAYLADVDRGALISRPLLESRGQALVWFRHPYLFTGETPEKKAAIAEGLAARHYRVAPVTIDNNDWQFAAAYRRAEAVEDAGLMRRIGEAYVEHMGRVLEHDEAYSAELTGGREPAQVLLLHASTLNRDWYPRIHALYRDRGYRFVSLDEAMADPLYARPETYVRANGISWLHRWMMTEGWTPRREPPVPDWVVEVAEGRSPAAGA